MGTTLFGNDPPRDNFGFTDGNSRNQVYNQLVTISDVGRIIDINSYFGGDTGSCTGGPVLYQGSNGNVLAYTAHTVSQGSHSSNGGSYTTTSGLDISFTSGTQFRLGGFRNSADSWVIPFADNVGNLGSLVTNTGTDPSTYSSAGAIDWNTFFGFNGLMSAYGTYFIATTWVRRSGAWTKLPWQVRRSFTWQNAPTPKVWVRRSGSWTQVGIVAKDQELDWKKEIPCIVEWARGVWEKALLRWEYDNKKTFGHKLEIA